MEQTVFEPNRIDDRRSAFNVPPEIAYFDTAYLSPQLHTVRAAGDAALERRGRPWAISADDWFDDVERLRSLFARVIGASAESVALAPATSYGFAVAARNLPIRAGQRVLVLAEEYPSGVFTWRAAARRSGAEILTVTRPPGRSWTDAVLAALDESVAIVSVPNVHWTDGALVDLAPIASRCHELGARLVIDGSQSVGAMPLDVGELKPDFLLGVAYKWLLGPLGVGYLYVAEEHHQGEPREENWIQRAGELTPMAIAALEQILEWRIPRIAATLARRTSEISQRAAGLGLDPMPDEQRSPHLLGIRLPRAGRGRAPSALADVNCFASVRGPYLRISPHLHTTDEDVDRLFDGLARTIRPETTLRDRVETARTRMSHGG
jgi:selenocysteine lyase/cysteine desulfurase